MTAPKFDTVRFDLLMARHASYVQHLLDAREEWVGERSYLAICPKSDRIASHQALDRIVVERQQLDGALGVVQDEIRDMLVAR